MGRSAPPSTRRSGYHSRGNVKVVRDPTGLYDPGASFSTVDIVEMVRSLALGFTIIWPKRGRCVVFPVGLIDSKGNVLHVNNGNHRWMELETG